MKKLLSIAISLFVFSFLVACQSESVSEIADKSAEQPFVTEKVQESEKTEKTENTEVTAEAFPESNVTKDLVQTSYAENIPWTSNSQNWAIVDLHVGPSDNWEENKEYYVHKYFSGMTDQERSVIKHYKVEDDHIYLFVPRYKSANTVVKVYLDFEKIAELEPGEEMPVEKEGDVICNASDGIPFSTGAEDPAGDMHPILKIRDDCGFEFVLNQNHTDTIGLELDDEKVLDLTEWQYFKH